MLNVPAALRLQAETAPPDRSRLTLNACANQVERAITVLEVAVEGLESLGPEFLAQSYAFHIRQAVVRLKGSAPAAPDLHEAAKDALAGWRYIREHHGDLYGVGWDRVEQALEAALAKAAPTPASAAPPSGSGLHGDSQETGR